MLAGAEEDGDHGPCGPQSHMLSVVCCVIVCVCVCLFFMFAIALVCVVLRVQRLHMTAISWSNWTDTQKMRAETIMRAMQRVEASIMGPEVWL